MLSRKNPTGLTNYDVNSITPYVGLDVVWRWPNGTFKTDSLFNISDAYPWVNLTPDPNWELHTAVASYNQSEATNWGFDATAPYIE